jgi:hypothetical protein
VRQKVVVVVLSMTKIKFGTISLIYGVIQDEKSILGGWVEE